MSNSKLAVEYFTNVEFENIDDPHILQTIYNEIKVCYFTIINHNKLSYKLELLLEKSTHAQRLQFLLQIENNNCQTKLGSRIVEKIFDLCENNFTDEDIETLTEKYEKDFVEMFIHKNSTFVIRKMLNQQFSKLNNNNIENVILNLKKIFCEDNALITLQKYLDAIEKKQKLIKHIINDYWHIEDMKSRRSYLFQRIVELANSKNRTRIFEKIKDDFIELCTDRYANFIVQELVSRDKENILFYYNIVKKNIQMFEKNSNIVIKLCAALCDEHSDKMYKLVSKFYLDGEDDIITGIMIKNGMIDTKYTKLVRCIFRKGNSEIYKSFVDHFTLAWLKQKSGREIFEEYLNAKSADRKALLVKVKKQMGEYTEERKMMQYLDMIFKKYK